MHTGGWRAARHWGLRLALALAPLPVAASAVAGEQRAYLIESGSLDDTLRAFIRQSGVQLLYPPELTRGRHATGLAGRMDAGHALARLLRDTGLRVVVVDDHTFVLKAAPPIALPPVVRPTLEPAPTPLTPVEVTGTHIRRTDVETASPVTVITREQIEHSGYQTLYDMLRAQPGIRVSNAPVGMSDGAVFQNNGLAGASGAAAVDLRGLGAAATLFLIDGQRMAGYGLAQDDFSTVTDLNSIPLALIERVEILRDGASAIYGSDAMAGVINVILRKTATGVTLSGSVGLSSRGDARQRRLTYSFGGVFGHNGHFLLSADVFERQPLLGRERDWSRPAHPTAATTDGRETPSDDSFYLDNASVRHLAADCSQEQRTVDGTCVDEAVAATSLQTRMLSRSVLAHLDRDVGPVQAYVDLRWTRLDQAQQSAPVKDDLLLPANHPDNTQHIARAIYDYSFNDLGPVRDMTVSTSRFVTVGLRGALGEGDWDVRLNDQRNDSEDRLDGLVRTDTFNSALARGAFRLDASNTPAVRAAVSPPLQRHARTSHNGVNASLTQPLATLPHGDLTLAVGAEAYRDRLSDQPDPLILTHRVFQFQTPAARSEDRWSTAAYMELNAPLTHRLNADLAWRIDRSQGYGHAVSPKLGLKWDLRDSLSLRGTWSRGYRAPTVLQLNHPATLASAGFWTSVPNRLLPCAVTLPIDDRSSYCEVRLTSVNNPRLRPETSHSYTLGTIWAPWTDASIALDYFRIRRDNEINYLPVSYALNHPRAYPRLFERNPSGELVALDQQLVNLGHTDARVVDLDARYGIDTRHAGHFDFRLGANYLMRLDRAVIEGMPVEHQAGYASQPRWSALAEVDWRYRDWTLSTNVRYTGAYRYTASSDDFPRCPDYLAQAGKCTTPAFFLVDMNLAFSGWKHWTLAFNVHNLFDHSPVYYGSPGAAYNPQFDDVVGRSFLMSFIYRP